MLITLAQDLSGDTYALNMLTMGTLAFLTIPAYVLGLPLLWLLTEYDLISETAYRSVELGWGYCALVLNAAILQRWLRARFMLCFSLLMAGYYVSLYFSY